ncbi:MAG: hypothetical protein NTW22_07740 [Proteobacteria bacterium]|nr:hypothetical protein [Pseudomonadota bacterium]
MSQLAENRKARVVINSSMIFFETSEKKNDWTFYTKVFVGEGDLPKSVYSYLSSRGVLRWENSGAYLKADPTACCIYLIQEVEMQEGKYIPFKHHLSEFSNLAEEWKEILQPKKSG